jgi:hypothetical protein
MPTPDDDLLNILDSEIDALQRGPFAWAREQQEKGNVDLESFRKEAVNRFAECGFRVNVLTYATDIQGVYAFDFELIGRTEKKAFDFDRMVYEVTNNILELPGEEKGFIKSPTGAEKAAAQHRHKH